MRKIGIILVLILLIGGIGGAVLATWDMPPPTQRMEKVIPNERLPR
ncbi:MULTISPECIES: hypothetical protein [Limibacillus]|jgi:hypothetical protein|uniref:Uncharacterized protein n=1 Tax=Limibacillus halophilus TaxID=1579333 RepID=A0A839SXT6_9PROT|nr:hypothetical protein [Limibacillus halophilus]MBB3066346.1 hypothetical protein [Limibacillus halophilus]